MCKMLKTTKGKCVLKEFMHLKNSNDIVSNFPSTLDIMYLHTTRVLGVLIQTRDVCNATKIFKTCLKMTSSFETVLIKKIHIKMKKTQELTLN